MQDEDLSVASFAAADADGRDLQAGCNLHRESGDDNFHDHGEGACLLHRRRIAPDSFGFLCCAAFHFVSTLFADVLREHADVGEHGNAGGDECTDLRGQSGAALEFDRLGPGFDETARIGHRFVRRAVGIDRQVGDDDGIFHAAGNRTGVADHVVEGDCGGVRVTEHDHTERVADKNEVGARFVDQTRRRVIIGGERGNFGPRAFARAEFPGKLFHEGSISRRWRPAASPLTMPRSPGGRRATREARQGVVPR